MSAPLGWFDGDSTGPLTLVKPDASVLQSEDTEHDAPDGRQRGSGSTDLTDSVQEFAAVAQRQSTPHSVDAGSTPARTDSALVEQLNPRPTAWARFRAAATEITYIAIGAFVGAGLFVIAVNLAARAGG